MKMRSRSERKIEQFEKDELSKMNKDERDRFYGSISTLPEQRDARFALAVYHNLSRFDRLLEAVDLFGLLFFEILIVSGLYFSSVIAADQILSLIK